jgi:TetR/AcrR family transcriptional regulator, transcriptional repressor of bet genes
MGRPSNREQRREEIVGAFERVLAAHGYAGATIAAVAIEAGVAPGLIHHHFENKEELLGALLRELLGRFRQRVAHEQSGDKLIAYVEGALRLDERADVTAARCWVGVFAEAVRNPVLFKQMRRLIDGEIAAIEQRSGHTLSAHDAGAVLAFIIGALVLGAFAPQKTAGFAAPALRSFVAALRTSRR